MEGGSTTGTELAIEEEGEEELAQGVEEDARDLSTILL